MDTDRQKESELARSRPGRLAVGGWISFEVANVVFWMGIVGMVFPLWAADDITVGYTLAATMTVVLLASPIIGALSDQSGRRKPYLMGAAAICVVATMFVGEVSLVSSLALFALAFTSMELATILYNSLLVDVSNSGNRGAIAGLGVGVGYLGAFIAVGCALIFSEDRGYLFVFKALAIIYFLFALPIFLFLKERTDIRRMRPKEVGNPIALAFAQIVGVATSLKRYPGLRPYLTARFFYMLGINTATAFAVRYGTETIGLDERKIQIIMIVGISVAVPSALIWGWMVDRFGSFLVLALSMVVWLGLLFIAVGIPWLGLPGGLWWLIGCMTGVGLAGIFTADRPVMTGFAPREQMAEFFALHAMAGKTGRVVGPFMWAFIAATLSFGQPAAILSLIGCLVIACAILLRVRDPLKSGPESAAEDGVLTVEPSKSQDSFS